MNGLMDFLKKTIKNCYQVKSGGYMLYNMKHRNINLLKKHKNLKINWTYTREESIELTLSKLWGKGHKYEPISFLEKENKWNPRLK